MRKGPCKKIKQILINDIKEMNNACDSVIVTKKTIGYL